MIYLFCILTNDGTYSGYASNKQDMEQEFMAGFPEITQFKVFLYGDVPEAISLKQYEAAISIFGDHDKARRILWYLEDNNIETVDDLVEGDISNDAI